MYADNRNLLYIVAAIGGLLLGLFLLAGAYGHLAAVLPGIGRGNNTPITQRLMLLLPGLLLLAGGILNVALCKVLWDGRQWALRLVLLCNALVLMYLVYLLWKGVPGHPVGMFLAMVACYVVVLGATRIGLVWPAESAAEDNN